MKITEISNSEVDRLISEWVKSERDRSILHRRLIDGVCFEQLSSEFYLSERQIKNIVYKNEKIIFKHVK